MDEIDKAKGDARMLKHSLVANGFDYKKLFPEYAPPPEEIKDETDSPAANDAEAVWDYSNVEWKSPSDDPGAFEKLMAEITKGNQMSGSDVVEQDPERIEWTDWR
jgi:hypothetical protein